MAEQTPRLCPLSDVDSSTGILSLLALGTLYIKSVALLMSDVDSFLTSSFEM